MSKDSFFDYVKIDEDTIEICLLSVEVVGGKNNRSKILPSKYDQLFDLKDDVFGKNLIITGPGPVEAYFALGYYFTLFGARTISYKHHTNELIALGINSNSEKKPWLALTTTDEGTSVVNLLKYVSDNGWWPDEKIGYDTCVNFELGASVENPIIFTGKGAVAMYALLGVSAAKQGLVDVRIEKPREPYIICFTPSSAGRIISYSKKKNGIVIGIIGDPNSGKSVLSHALFLALSKSNPKWFTSWIYDCDLASPTPDWYCDALATSPEQESIYKAMRESYKASWGPDMEKRCTADLGVLRKNLDLVLADLPGGRHPKDGENFTPMRIPSETRAEMFKECDCFILLCRKDKKEIIFNGWYDALSEYNLQDRIICVIDSSNPSADFEISDFQQNDQGVFTCSMQGLDRKQGSGVIGGIIAEKATKLIQYLSSYCVFTEAIAATSRAFLTGDGGTRYGAAVRSVVSGKIYSAAQYSSFNHSTNIHAEMGALFAAANAGEPDIDILALACTSGLKAIPCGMCRQVMLEHSMRTGRDFFVALVYGPTNIKLLRLSELLPLAWDANIEQSNKKEDVRVLNGIENVFTESNYSIGAEFVKESAFSINDACIALVWDSAFTKNKAIIKYKYLQQKNGLWKKLPHAFTEAKEYQKFLNDLHINNNHFTGLPTLQLDESKNKVVFKNPIPLPEEELKLFSEIIFAPAGIAADTSVRVTCSRMLGNNTPNSDWDLAVVATPEQVIALRKHIAELIKTGVIQFSTKSKSWEYLKKAFPRAKKEDGKCLIEEARYVESFIFGRYAISIMFITSFVPEPAMPEKFAVIGRTSVCGYVVDAKCAPYKRSESIIRTLNNELLRLICYHKVGNILKEGDFVSVSGVLCEHQDVALKGCKKTLVLGSSFTDKIVWMS